MARRSVLVGVLECAGPLTVVAKMRRVVRALMVVVLAIAGGRECVAQGTSGGMPAPAAGELNVLLRGEWRGVLEYKDYQKPDKRVTLPTTLSVANGFAEGVSMHWVYDDGPGKTVIEDDRFVMAADRATLDWTGLKDKEATIWTVRSYTRTSEGGLKVVMEREGMDDNKPATIRDTIVLSRMSFGVLKEVRFGAGEAFTFRHEYRMTR